MLQETKIEGDALLDLSKVKWKTKAGKAVSARGSCGGIPTLWEEDKFHLESSFQMHHWIYIELKNLASKITFTLFYLYVCVLYAEKNDCWQTLFDFLDAYSPKNITLAGDYDLIFEPKEKGGGISSRDHLLPFLEDLVRQWDLLDFKPKKGLYTWSNNRAGAEHLLACLDIFSLQITFLSKKKIISTKILLMLTSDHKPILFMFEEEEKLGPIPFRLSPIWSDREGFMDIVMKAWSIPVLRSPSYVWEQKLKDTKTTLKEWIKNPSDSPTRLRKHNIERLLDLQLDMEPQDITHSEF